jgi:hypothetical protein
MISSMNDSVFIRDLNKRTLPIKCGTWWASLNVGSKRPIDWNDYKQAPSWQSYLHCGIVTTGSPGIICIVCHHSPRPPSKQGTSSMGKHMLPNAQIAKLNKLTESEVTKLTSWTVDKTVVAILNRHGSHGIPVVSSPCKFTFDFGLYLYWPNWQPKRSKLAVMDCDTVEFHQDTGNCYPMFGFVSADIPWNAILNWQLQRSYHTLRSELVTPSPITL